VSGYLGMVLAVAGKDLRLEFRTRERVVAMAAFAVLVAILFHFSLDRSVVRPREVAAGWIWMTIIFTGLLGLGRTFELEREDGAFRGVLLTPIPRDALYLGKVLSNFLLTLGVSVFVLAAFGLFFSLEPGRSPLVLLAVVALGVLGFTALVTLFSAVTVGTRMGEALLPLLAFPLLVPMVIYGVTATAGLMAGLPPGEVGGNVRMLAAFDLLALAAGAVLFRFVVEE